MIGCNGLRHLAKLLVELDKISVHQEIIIGQSKVRANCWCFEYVPSGRSLQLLLEHESDTLTLDYISPDGVYTTRQVYDATQVAGDIMSYFNTTKVSPNA